MKEVWKATKPEVEDVNVVEYGDVEEDVEEDDMEQC